MKKIALSFFMVFMATVVYSATGSLTLTSGNKELNDGFAWAKQLALSYVQTGKQGVAFPCYQGSYVNDPQFCVRDICHQSEAGHLLGLDDENFYMLKAFAHRANTNDDNCRLHWPYWKITFTGEGSHFTPELPTPLELSEKSINQYIWTANPRWITDTEFKSYYLFTNTTLMDYLDSDDNSIVDINALISKCNDGLASYWEFPNNPAFESADALGSQYQSYVAYAKYLSYIGSPSSTVSTFQNKADQLRKLFNTTWFSPEVNRFHSGTSLYNGQTPITDWTHEQSIFVLLKQLITDSLNISNYVKFVHGNSYNQTLNIEATTYLAEAFFLENANHVGWNWLLYDLRSRDTYPEVSFLAIRNIVCGLLGVIPDAPNAKVSTLSHLISDVPWVEVNHIPLGINDLKLRHDGLTSSTLTNNSGSDITWQAQFYGRFSQLLINGVSTTAAVKTINGKEITYVDVPVSVGNTVTVVTPSVKKVFTYLSDTTYTSVTNAANIHYDNCATGYVLTLKDSDPLNATYTKGIGVRNTQTIEYNLNKKYYGFSALLGVDLAKNNSQSGSVVFSVVADGKTLYTSQAMTKDSAPVPVRLDMTNITTLQLKTVTTGSSDKVYGDWIEAKLLAYPQANYEITSAQQQVVQPGTSADLKLHIANTSSYASAGNITVTCKLVSDNGAYITVNQPTVTLSALAANTSVDQLFNFTIEPSVPAATHFQLEFVVTDGVSVSTYQATLVTPFPILSMDYNSIQNRSSTVIADNLFNAGDTGEAVLTVYNTGSASSQPLLMTAQVTDGSQYLTLTSPIVNVPAVAAKTSSEIRMPLKVSSEAPLGQSITVKYTLTQTSDNAIVSSVTKSYSIATPVYSFDYKGLSDRKNHFAMIAAGDTTDVKIAITNTGTKNGEGGSLTLSKIEDNQSIYTIPATTVAIPAVAVNKTAVVTFPLVLNNSSIADNTRIGVSVKVTVGSSTQSMVLYFVTGKVYCSDMDYSETVTYAYSQRDMEVFKSAMVIAGTTYYKGIGCHAQSAITFNLNKSYSNFSSDVGMDGEHQGTCNFQVYLDNVLTWESGVLKGTDKMKKQVSLDVSNANVMKLVMTDGGDGINDDHGDWGNAALTPILVASANPEVDDNSGLTVFPTVCRVGDPLHLRTNEMISDGNIRLIDLEGKTILCKVSPSASGSGTWILNTSNLCSGIYILRVAANTTVQNFKIIIR